jgi:2-methylisocitrate lyase-like PEP mutase family enzyme
MRPSGTLPDGGSVLASVQRQCLYATLPEAGADVVYAPGLPDIETVRTVCQSVLVPVNVVVGLSATTYSVDDLSAACVRRISTGGSLARAALGEMIRPAQELKDCGTYEYSKRPSPMPMLPAKCELRRASRTDMVCEAVSAKTHRFVPPAEST